MLIKRFLTALMFYTRIPVHASHDQNLEEATLFLPIIGLLVGGISAAVWFAAQLLFPHSVSLVIAMIVGVFLTGAFHEDGFVDSCDGLGGGFSVQDKLRIMKDSRVGAYGLIGALLLFLFKYAVMLEIPARFFPAALVLVQVLSRLVPVYLIRILPYVRDDGTSKVHQVSRGMKPGDIIFATVSAIAIACAICYFAAFWELLYVLISLPIFIIITALHLHHQLKGYTGDLLGASQQITEGGLLALVLIVCRYLL